MAERWKQASGAEAIKPQAPAGDGAGNGDGQNADPKGAGGTPPAAGATPPNPQQPNTPPADTKVDAVATAFDKLGIQKKEAA